MKKMFSLEELLSNCFFPFFRSNLTVKFDKKQARFQEINRKYSFLGIFPNIPQNLFEHSLESSATFPGIFNNILRNLLENSPESSLAFPRIFNNIPRNPLEYSPDSSRTFPGIFSSIPRNAKIRTFPGILVNIPSVPCIPAFRSPFLYSWFYK